MAKPYLGQLSAFQPDEETISAYLERTDIFFQANDITEDKRKVTVFLNAIGAKTYTLLRDLLSPAALTDKTFKELSDALKAHFEPKPLVIAERYNFHQRSQKAGESVAEYLAELRKLALHCDFGAFLNDALRDRLVCGLRSTAAQKQLLTQTDLTLEKALRIAQGMEAADEGTKKLHDGVSSSTTVNHAGPPPQSRIPNQLAKPCYHCGNFGHTATACRFCESTCNKCHKKGHIARACQSGSKRDKHQQADQSQTQKYTANRRKFKGTSKNTYTIREPDSGDEFPLLRVGGKSVCPIMVELRLNGVKTQMELDTGATVSIISTQTKDKLFPQDKLTDSSLILTTYSGEQLVVAGLMFVNVKYGKQQHQLPVYVVKGNGPSLMGRDWFQKIRLNWKQLKLASVSDTQATGSKRDNWKQMVESILDTHKNVFQDGLGQINTFEATLQLKEGAIPKFCKARPVPFALKAAVERELDRLESEGILKKVSYSEWAAPVVPVPKAEGTIRLCGDYKVTINPQLEVDQYPLPKPDNIFATLSEGKWFSKIDLKHAYQQLELAESCRPYVTINTRRGLYQYTRLPFGVASAPALFQKVMDTVLQGLPKVICYLDDILISGSTQQEHLDNLRQVLQRLEQYGIRARRSKCAFMCEAVEYLGHRVDAEGLHTLDTKVTAVLEAPSPQDVQELRSFLGLIHYYGKFLPSLSTLLHPLNNLLKAGNKWEWSTDCETALTEAKKLLASAPVLAHYNPSLQIRLAGDASAYGIGAVISHVFDDGTERPVAYASRTLTSAERNYSQLEKEALSLIFGVQKFHQYLYGRSFVLITDHKPLTTILGPKRGIPPLAAARLQRWAYTLSAYSYSIEFRPTKQHANADGLSRLPLGTRHTASVDSIDAFLIGQIQALPVTATQVQTATRQDLILSQVFRYVQDGWPVNVDQVYKPFANRKEELSIEAGCLLWGNRVIIPTKLRSTLIDELHRDHPGASRMKAVARSYFWYPGLDKDLENRAHSCVTCQAVKNAPPAAPLHPWLWPAQPWQRIHVDFAGPFMGKTYMLVVDAHSKWPEIIEMHSTTAQRTIAELRKLFAAYGLPTQLVSDNGPQFIAEEFESFLQANGIKHVKCAPYHPASNGAVERLVQTFKKAMKTAKNVYNNTEQALANFLLTYRSTPHSTTNEPPSKLFLGRKIRTRLDLLLPSHEKTVVEHQAQQKSTHDKRATSRELSVGEAVMARNNKAGMPYVPGKVKKKIGPLTYLIETENGQIWKRHIDHLKSLGDGNVPISEDEEQILYPIEQEDIEPNTGVTPDNANTSESDSHTDQPPSTRRYPQRESRHPPLRYGQETDNWYSSRPMYFKVTNSFVIVNVVPSILLL